MSKYTRYPERIHPGNMRPMNLEEVSALANKGHSIKVYTEQEVRQIVSTVLSDSAHDDIGVAVMNWREFADG